MTTLSKQTIVGKIHELLGIVVKKVPDSITTQHGKMLTPSATEANTSEWIDPPSGGLGNPTVVYNGVTTSGESIAGGSISSSVIPSTAKIIGATVVSNHYTSGDVKIEAVVETLVIPADFIIGTSTITASLISNSSSSLVKAYDNGGIVIISDITSEYSDDVYESYWKTEITFLCYWA